jgi:hypothetical protein
VRPCTHGHFSGAIRNIRCFSLGESIHLPFNFVPVGSRREIHEVKSMTKIIMLGLATMIVVAPMAAAEARDNHRHEQKYPKGWGPHRGPDGHGYRGSHERHNGYRRGKDGLWYPAAAFTIGAIIGGALGR